MKYQISDISCLPRYGRQEENVWGERVPPIPYRNVTNIKKNNLC